MTTTPPRTSARSKAKLDPARVRALLNAFNFNALLIEEMGWDRHTQTLTVPVDGKEYRLEAVAEKRGDVIFVCSPGSDGSLPEQTIRQKIDQQVTKSAREHLIVFVDSAKTMQIWQWVKREQGKVTAFREWPYRRGQFGQALIEKFHDITYGLNEEEGVTLLDVTQRMKTFDVDRVTKRFYERFKEEHKRFLAFIEGIPIADDRAWYASLMLNRLMFVYFIQKKGFLDGDRNYLRNRLDRVRAEHGAGRFHSFYRAFLLRLFHEGLGGALPHAPELVALIGDIPYLNGGIFDIHQLEERYPEIEIPDEAFAKIFEFFEQYQWHLDERPLRNDNEINPDVLGYIFEKYINQKEMGAYYTKEDITEYISKSTIIPFLFDVAERKCRVAFEGQPSVWDLLREDPDRYIYEAVRKGAELPLPPETAAGIDDVAQRGGWNRPAPDEYALPTEIWREVVARRQRYAEVRAKLAAGEVRAINDLITENLDLRRLALDAIQYSEGPELLRAFYQAITDVKVLDPTCGSGAFLFAALNILEPLYDACLGRMEAFIAEAERLDEAGQSRRYSDFRATLARIETHPNRRYFILKEIVVRNLYGVDIMEESVEICKLRLFLKLVAQVEDAQSIEPLPDIDFNVRAGNTLVGFASRDEVSKAVNVGTDTKQLGYAFLDDLDRMAQIDEDAAIISREFAMFQNQQTASGGEITAANKQALRAQLDALAAKLDRYLAAEYGIDAKSIPDEAEYERRFITWKESHKPFHWFAEFYAIMQRGGFDVIIGNPPYVEYSTVKKNYTVIRYLSESCGNVYTLTMERSARLEGNHGRTGLIVPVSFPSSQAMASIRKVVRATSKAIWLSHFANRPSQLFAGAQNRLTIMVTGRGLDREQIFSTKYLRWENQFRENDLLFETLEYTSLDNTCCELAGLVPKAGSHLAVDIINKMANLEPISGIAVRLGHCRVYWVRVPGYYCQFFIEPPKARSEQGGPERNRGELNSITLSDGEVQRVVHATLSSGTFYHYYSTRSDGRHINPSDVSLFPVGSDIVDGAVSKSLSMLSRMLEQCMQQHTSRWRKSGLLIDTVDSASCKPIIDEIDRVLARHYGFSDEELDFIINYDIKYRTRRDAGGDGE